MARPNHVADPTRPPEVARVLERVTATVRAHGMLAQGDRVLIAVSGGPDSLCLLHALVALRDLLRIDIGVFHFDHGLRADAGEVADRVRDLTRVLGLPFHLDRATDAPSRGDSVEDWAHRVRATALAAALDATGSDIAATGHTRDDQAETVLIGLFRGGGLSAVAGIEPVAGRVVRPLIDVSRDEVERFVVALGLEVDRDPMNEDPGLLRNAIRREVLPAAERATGRDLRATIARSASHLRRDARALDAMADEAAVTVIVSSAGADGPIVLDAASLSVLDEAVAARVALRALYALGPAPTSSDVGAVLDLARGRRGRRRDLTGGSTATREVGSVVLMRTGDSREVGGAEGAGGADR